MTPFRQPIRLGDKGADVLAVKRALRRMGVTDRGLLLSPRAGGNFVHAIETVQRRHTLRADGVYGPSSHRVIAPHFDGYGVWLYRHAQLRRFDPNRHSARECAQQLLRYHAEGKYRADNPSDLRDIEATARGSSVWSRGGYYVHIDARVMRLLCYLIGKGFRIGTFAICSDHFNDGPHGHAGGMAVDISSINGVSVASGGSRSLVLAVDRALHAAGPLRPRQLITGGYGYRRDAEISALSIPGADWYYGSRTMGEHTNHCHVGV